MRPKVLRVSYETLGWYLQCHGSDGYSPTTHHGNPGSIPVQPMRNFWWKKWHCVRGFSEYCGLSPVIVIPPMLHNHLHLLIALTRMTNGRSLRTFQKTGLFRKPRSLGQKCTFTYSSVAVFRCVESDLKFINQISLQILSPANYGSCAV